MDSLSKPVIMTLIGTASQLIMLIDGAELTREAIIEKALELGKPKNLTKDQIDETLGSTLEEIFGFDL